MKQFFIYLLLFICTTISFTTNAQSGSGWEWSSTTGIANATKGIRAITTDASGNVYVTGGYYDSLTLGGTTFTGTPSPSNHGFVAKYDNLGNILWVTAVNDGLASTIAIDADGNSYIGGNDRSSTTSNIGFSFAAKYDNNGNKVWYKIFTLNEVIAINVGPDGNPIAVDMLPGYRNIYKLNKIDGSIIWTVINTGTNIASDAAASYGNFLDSKGNVYYTLIGFIGGTNTQVVAGISFINLGNTTCLVSLDNNGNRRWIDSAHNDVLSFPTAGTCVVGKNDKIYYNLGISASTSGISGTNQPLTAQAAYFELDDLGKVVVSKFTYPFAGKLTTSIIKSDAIYSFTSVPGGYASYVVSYGDYSYASPTLNTSAISVIIKYDPITYKVIWANSFESSGTSAQNVGGINRMDITPAGKVVIGGNYGATIKFGITLKTAVVTATNPYGKADLYVAQFDGANVALPPSTTWTGAANNMNFNDPANWDNGVPNAVKTIIPGGLSNYPNNITAAAKIGKLEIGAGATINLPLAISIPNGVVNNGSIELTEAGFFYGGFNTGQTIISGSGKVVIKNNTVKYFGYVDLDNSLEINCAGVVSGLGGTINGSLILTNGIFSGGITLSNPNATITNTATSYITGTLKRRINASGTYNFPVGNSTIYAPVTLTLTNITGPQYISVNLPENYAQVIGTTPNINLGSQLITTKLNKNQWNVVADADATGGSYAISLEARGYTNGVTDASSYIVIKRQADDKPWSFNGTNGVSTQVSNVANASASGITSFSTFGIGIASASVAAGTTPTTSNWTGNANTIWNNAANWDNGIPNSLINAVIGTGKTNYPLVYASIDNARSLQVNASTNIKLPYLFTVNSEIINNGTIEVTGANSANFNSFGNSTFGYSKLSGNGKLLFTTASPGNILGGYDNSIEINTSSNSLYFNNVFLSGSINIISGYLTGTALTLTNPNATITSSSNYYFSGTLNRAVNASGTYNYPIGAIYLLKYSPVTISTNNLAGTTMLSAFYIQNSYSNGTFAPIDGEPVAQLNVGKWTITPNNPATAGTINMTLQATGYSNGTSDLNRYVLLKSGATNWEKVSGATFTQSNGVITATINNLPALTKQTDYIIGIKGLTTQWTGAANNQSWTTANNWTNGVPDNTYKAVFVAGSPNYPLTITANNDAAIITIASGVTLKLPQDLNIQQGIINNGTIEVSGTNIFGGFAFNPSTLSGTGKLLFTNNSPYGIYSGTIINNSIELNRTGNFTITTPSINGSLILTNGIMVGDITLTNPNATITANASSYVNGKIIQSVNTSGTYNFPVGNATSYAPVLLKLNGIAGTQKITASFNNNISGATPNTIVGGQTVTSLLNSGIWTITPDVALTGGSYNVTLEGRSFTNSVTDATRYVVLKRANSSSAWAFFGNNGIATYSATAITATAGNITGFSDFAIGIASASVLVTLPVTYTYFTAEKSSTQALLKWQTAQEINNNYFNVQQSNNAFDWATIGKVNAASNIGLNNYQFVHTQLVNGINYYRLQQVDKDGKSSFSDIRRVDMGITKANLKLYPNPAVGNTVTLDYGIQITKPLTYKIIDVAGRIMQTGNIANQQETINLNSLQKGNYKLVVSGGQVTNFIKM